MIARSVRVYFQVDKTDVPYFFIAPYYETYLQTLEDIDLPYLYIAFKPCNL
jgi:hypothetical protein